ncbi:MAG: arginase family protein, partial [Proteobacteria bacterium]|nr:arginase family protein [Pseudomonadota bacterium]
MAKTFDPNAAAKPGTLFGLDSDLADSKIVMIPVPWEVTTSYGGGTAKGPQEILSASAQVDLYDTDAVDPYTAGLHMLPISKTISNLNKKFRALALTGIKKGGFSDSKVDQKKLAQVNAASDQVNEWVYAETKKLLKQDKIVAVIGGDHSVPFGAIKAVSEKHPNMGVLHF